METFMFLGFGLDAWITIILVLVVLGVLLYTKLPSDLVFLSAVSVLYITGVLDASEALSGFSSSTVAIVGAMGIMVAGLTYTGVMHLIVRYLLGRPKGYVKSLLRLMLPVALLSSFINSATVVVLFTGVVKLWSRKLKVTPSRLLIPLSYAGAIGGAGAIISTPACLIIADYYHTKSGQSMSLLAPALPTLFGLVAAFLTIILLRRLLPERKAPEAAFETTGDYTVELLVPSDNPHVAKRVGQLGLNNVRGGSLIELRHFDDDKLLSPVPDKEPLMGGDRLVFAGQIDELLELKKTYGLVSADHHVFKISEVDTDRKLRTAYVKFGSRLIHTRIGGGTFEKDNNMTLVAVSRRGNRIEQPPREVVLEAGDTLLLACSPHGNTDTATLHKELQFFDSADIVDIGRGTLISSVIMVMMVILAVASVMPLLKCALLASGAMLLCRCCSPSQAMSSINWSLLASLAASIVFGHAIQKTGIAEWLARSVLDISGSNPLMVMIAISLVVAIITEFFSNTAVAAMTVPIMYTAARQLGYDPYPFLVALILAANNGFASPFSSSLHMMVYGPGGYRFSDFVRIGVPVKFAVLAVGILVIYLIYPFMTR